jgi:catechol 2,3-dioxygenase-like lactoylglutathione lyase family enzyme
VTGVTKLSRIRLIAAQPQQLAAFYESAFGFERTTQSTNDAPDFAKLIGVPGATAGVVALRLGEEHIELVGVHPTGRSLPPIASWSPLFQHCAIVVSDMAAAYARLCAQTGWTAISKGGPQVLPPASGGVAAFKFRDPEGHPLELLAFTPGGAAARWKRSSAGDALGIDHSAISVADTSRSIAFYQRFGLRCVGGSLNVGPAQDRLDDVAGARVEVTALAPALHPTPHVELLCYRGTFDRTCPPPEVNDIAASELVFSVDNNAVLQAILEENLQACISGPLACEDAITRALFRDPDDHLLCLEGR